MQKRLTILGLVLAMSVSCGSSYTILDTGQLTISANSRVSAQTLIPNASRYPDVVQKLALAEEVYERQLYLLKQRRNKLRARTRYLNAASYVTYTGTSVGIGLTAISGEEENAGANLEGAGYAALGGLALGTMFQVVGWMQEDMESIDGKIRHLDGLHNEMIDKLRQLASLDLDPPVAEGGGRAVVDIQFEMSRVIQEFINKAKLINVKG